MAKRDYDRYALLRREGEDMEPMPFVRLPDSPTDKYENWRRGSSRFDKFAEKYYGNPFYDFFILMANPRFLNEWEIPDNTTIRIPFPLSKVKAEYENLIEKKAGV